MTVFKKILLGIVLLGLLFLMVIFIFNIYKSNFPTILPEEQTSIEANNGTKVEIHNVDKVSSIKALSPEFFKISSDEKTYSSSPTTPDFNKSTYYLEIPIKNQIYLIEASNKVEIHFINKNQLSITVYEPTTDKIGRSLSLSVFTCVLGVCAGKIIKKLFKRKKTSAT